MDVGLPRTAASRTKLPYDFAYKYQAVNTSNLSEYTKVLRLAEQYLIRAKAEANLGDLADAINDLNTIRGRASLNPYNPAVKEGY
jgi:hypothetical protein